MAAREVKVFAASVENDEEQAEPYPFRLVFRIVDEHGIPTTDEDGNEYEEHDFLAAADPGAGASFAAAAVLRWSEEGKLGVDLNAIITFFNRVLTTDDLERMKELLGRKDLSIRLEQMAEVYQWLVEEYGRSPYAAAVVLLDWAARNWASLDGATLLSGCDLNRLPLPRLMNVIYATLTRDMKAVDKARLDAQLDWPIDTDHWGETAAAEAGQDAFMRLMQGGSAG